MFSSVQGPARRLRIATVIGGAALAVTGTLAGNVSHASAAPAGHFTPQTVVSLTFDDSDANQVQAANILAGQHLTGTFYAVSGWVGMPGYLTQADLQSLQKAGNEIGGHTVQHPDLTQVAPDEARREVCNDRATLTSWGLRVTDFAYPFSSVNPAVEAIVKACGYDSARGLGDLSGLGTTGLPATESIPPADPFDTAAPNEAESTTTLAQLEDSVTAAQKTGGWLQLTFHNICAGTPATGCAAPSLDPTTFTQFATWLAGRKASGVKVANVNTVSNQLGTLLNLAPKPVVTAPIRPIAAAGVNGLTNPGLDLTGNPIIGSTAIDTLPTCWGAYGFGANTPAYSRIPGRSGAATDYAERIDVTGYSGGDAKILPKLDLGQCAPSVSRTRTYTASSSYRATVASQYDAYYRDAVGHWLYLTSSPYFAPSATWATATWTLPALPAGATAVSVGLAIFSNGELDTDSYTLTDTGAAASTVPVTANPPAVVTANPLDTLLSTLLGR